MPNTCDALNEYCSFFARVLLTYYDHNHCWSILLIRRFKTNANVWAVIVKGWVSYISPPDSLIDSSTEVVSTLTVQYVRIA